jgi:hypothetical protein
MIFIREIDNEIYTRKALADTRGAYGMYCDISVLPMGSSRAKITVTIKPTYLPDAKQIILELWNYFLDSSCKDYLESH